VIYTEMLALVRRARLGGASRKLVMMVLAEHCGIDANGDWSCFPSQGLIAGQVELSERQVRAILADFEVEGLVERHSRPSVTGRGRSSDRITLCVHAMGERVLDQPEVSAGRSPDQPEVEAGPTGSLGRPTGSLGSTNRKPTSGEQLEQSGGTERTTPLVPQRGSRLSDSFAIDDVMRAWAAREVPGVDIDFETAKFIDHWRGTPGARGRKLDWIATWRNWLRNADDRAAPRSRPSRPPAARSDKRATDQTPGRVQL
jgi:hypothetical protein